MISSVRVIPLAGQLPSPSLYCAAPDHSITSSARASSNGGTSSPSALAWRRLHRQIGRLLAIEYAIDIPCRVPVRVRPKTICSASALRFHRLERLHLNPFLGLHQGLIRLDDDGLGHTPPSDSFRV